MSCSLVVYLSLPTSNHNWQMLMLSPLMLYIFRFLHQTTTWANDGHLLAKLYIFRFLHQTTTLDRLLRIILSCISFASYIKPQLNALLNKKNKVVYLSLPTSNHNTTSIAYAACGLYIFRFLHQTTTKARFWSVLPRCISFASYIKPQQVDVNWSESARCISFASYIKPQL